MIIVIILLLVFVGLPVYFIFFKTLFIVKDHWKHYFKDPFSAVEFYAVLETELKSRGIEDDISIKQESFIESHIFSAKRNYLRVRHKEYTFYVGAAPFAQGMFVSWWFCVNEEKPMNKIPLLSRLMGKDRTSKTFYQMDREAMFVSAIHTIVLEVVESMAAEKGIRPLSDTERQYIPYTK